MLIDIRNSQRMVTYANELMFGLGVLLAGDCENDQFAAIQRMMDKDDSDNRMVGKKGSLKYFDRGIHSAHANRAVSRQCNARVVCFEHGVLPLAKLTG